MNDDNNTDILYTASYSIPNRVSWYENSGSTNFIDHNISIDAQGANNVFAIDVDRDGDMDTISSHYEADAVVWYENDGSSNFTSHTLLSNSNGASDIYAIDIDGDKVRIINISERFRGFGFNINLLIYIIFVHIVPGILIYRVFKEFLVIVFPGFCQPFF